MTIVNNANLKPDEKVLSNGQLLPIDAAKGLYFRRLSLAPLKGEARCVEKAVNEYDGDYSKLVDVVRCSIVVDTEDQLEAVARALLDANATSYRVVRLKNRFKDPLFNGYRDALYSISVRVVLAGGGEIWHVCEVQLHLAAVLAHKEESHEYYEFFRGYFKGNVNAVESQMAVLEAVWELCAYDAGGGDEFDLDGLMQAVAAGEMGVAGLEALAELFKSGLRWSVAWFFVISRINHH